MVRLLTLKSFMRALEEKKKVTVNRMGKKTRNIVSIFFPQEAKKSPGGAKNMRGADLNSRDYGICD